MIPLKKICKNTILFFFVFLLILPNHSRLYAEDPDQTFKSLSFRLNLLTNTNRNTLHQYWTAIIGGEAEVELPFYAGKIKAGLHLFQFNGINEEYPDYLVSYFYIGWGGDISLSSQISWFNGIRLGSYQMRFDDTDINPTQRFESELGAGIDSRLDLKISTRWSGQIGIGYIAIFTHKKLELINLSIGISYTIDSPSWFTELLK
jgi:hypothetical protein